MGYVIISHLSSAWEQRKSTKPEKPIFGMIFTGRNGVSHCQEIWVIINGCAWQCWWLCRFVPRNPWFPSKTSFRVGNTRKILLFVEKLDYFRMDESHMGLCKAMLFQNIPSKWLIDTFYTFLIWNNLYL